MARLIWKEWHEQRWKLTFCSVILAAFAMIGLHARIISDAMVVESICVLAVCLLPILASMGLTPAERGEGSLEVLLALPVTARQVFSSKMLMGLAVCAGPLASAAIVTLLMVAGRELTAVVLLGIYARAAATTMLLLIWMTTLTVLLPDEARAGLLGIGVLVLWSLISEGFSFLDLHQLWIFSPLAFAFATTGDDSRVVVSPWLTLLIQVIAAGGLWIFGARRLASHREHHS